MAAAVHTVTRVDAPRPLPVFTVTGHPVVSSSSSPARLVCAIGADVITPGSVSGVDRERLTAMLEQLEPGASLELERVQWSGRGTFAPRLSPVTVHRNR